MQKLIQDAYKQYRYRWKQALLSSLGIVIATIALILIQNVADMLLKATADRFKINGGYAMTLFLNDISGDIYANDYQKALLDTTYDYHLIAHDTLKVHDRSLHILATDNLATLSPYTLLEGRHLHPNDAEHYVLITKQLRNYLASQGMFYPLEQDIVTNEGIIRFIGVIEDFPLPMHVPKSENGMIILSSKAYTSLFKKPPSEILVTLDNLNEADIIDREIQAVLKKHFPKINIHTFNPHQLIEVTHSMHTFIQYLAYLAVTICSVLGGIGIMNMRIADITSRKSEIALRIAFGATNTNIKQMVILESAIICIASSLIGTIIGILITYFIACLLKLSFMISLSSIITALTFSLMVGIISSLYPAKLISKIPVAYLLKGE